MLNFRYAAASVARKQSIRFIVAGGLASAINWVSRFPLSMLLPFEVAVGLAYGIGMGVGFILYRAWVFRGSQGRVGQQVWKFLIVNIIGLTTVSVAAHILLVLIIFFPLVSDTLAQGTAHALAIAVGALVNFIGHRSVTFRVKGAE